MAGPGRPGGRWGQGGGGRASLASGSFAATASPPAPSRTRARAPALWGGAWRRDLGGAGRKETEASRAGANLLEGGGTNSTGGARSRVVERSGSSLQLDDTQNFVK